MPFFRKLLLAGCAIIGMAVTAARAAVTLGNVAVTNLGSTTFTVVWTTSEESTPGLEVFSDAAGATNITSSLTLDYYPIGAGDPGVASTSATRDARRTLELLAIQKRVVSVRVAGLSAGTTYYIRPHTFDGNGADNGAAVLPLTAVTTAQTTSLISDTRLLRIHFPTFSAQGMIVLVQGPSGTTPLSAIIGDGAGTDTGVVSTAFLIDASTGTNPQYTGPQTFTIRVLGFGAPAGTSSQIVNFGSTFSVAQVVSLEAAIENPGPHITTQPTHLAVAAGMNATFTVIATGTPAPTYQWQRKASGGSTFVDLVNDSVYSGVSSATLTVTAATISMSGDQFRVLVTNGAPPDALSDVATLTVTASAVAPNITTHPAPASVVVGSNAAFAVVATGVPTPTYQWQRKAVGAADWTNLANDSGYSGVTSPNLTVVQPTLAASGDLFRVVVANGVSPDATSHEVALTVSSGTVAPLITTPPVSKSVGLGADATFTVVVTGTPTPTVKWQIKLFGTSAWIDLTTTPNYTGITTTTLTVKSVTAGMSGDQFRAVATNGTAPDATSDPATLTIVASPTITGHPQSVTFPVGGTAAFAVLANGTGSLAYQWQRRVAGSEVWQDLVANAIYTDVNTVTLRVVGVLFAMNGDQFRCVVTDSIGSAASNPATLTVTKSTATVTLGNLAQPYDGTPRIVSAATVPAGLTVNLTYNGSATAPTVPGTYTVNAQISDLTYTGTATAELVVTPTVLVRHAPTLAGLVDGSLQLATPENLSLSGTLSGDLLLPGFPTVVADGTLAGYREGPGAATPTSYSATLTSSSIVRYLVRKVDALTLPTLPAVPASTGTRNVTLSAAGQTAGDFTTVRNLSISGTVGSVAVPPGTYGALTTSGSAVFVLGVAGATEPAVYNIQSLSINVSQTTAKLVVVGPVILNVASTVVTYGDLGVVEHPEWLTLNAVAGGVSAASRGAIYGYVVAPNSLVALNGTATLVGGVIADRLTVTVNASLKRIPVPDEVGN